MIGKHVLPQLSHQCRVAMPCSTQAHQLAGESAIFILVLPAGPLPARALAPKHSGLCGYGEEDTDVLVPVQVHALIIKRSQLIPLWSAGFLLWIGRGWPCHAMGPRVVPDDPAGDRMEPAQEPCLGGSSPGSLPRLLLHAAAHGTGFLCSPPSLNLSSFLLGWMNA